MVHHVVGPGLLLSCVQRHNEYLESKIDVMDSVCSCRLLEHIMRKLLMVSPPDIAEFSSTSGCVADDCSSRSRFSLKAILQVDIGRLVQTQLIESEYYTQTLRIFLSTLWS